MKLMIATRDSPAINDPYHQFIVVYVVLGAYWLRKMMQFPQTWPRNDEFWEWCTRCVQFFVFYLFLIVWWWSCSATTTTARRLRCADDNECPVIYLAEDMAVVRLYCCIVWRGVATNCKKFGKHQTLTLLFLFKKAPGGSANTCVGAERKYWRVRASMTRGRGRYHSCVKAESWSRGVRRHGEDDNWIRPALPFHVGIV